MSNAMPYRRSPFRFSIALALVAASLGGCLSTPADRSVVAPAAWDTAAGASAWPEADWWRGFGSAELDGLIAAAQVDNLDLGAAAARLLQAEAQARIAGAALLPSVDLSAGAGRAGTFGGGDSNAINTGSGTNSGRGSSYNASLGASYELDFWGRNRAGRDAAAASLRASRYDQATVALTVTAGVANNYLQVVGLRERLAIARLNLEIAERVLRLVEARQRYGAVTLLDVAQQRSAVASQRAAIPPLEQQERDARSALAQLLGRPPQGFGVDSTELNVLQVPVIGAGLPAELLARRPDIGAAEAQLAAADANLVAARAALFPSFRLTGSTGVQSSALRELFDGSAVYNIGASVAQSVFDGGRLRGQRDIAAARQLELLQNYRKAVLAGFADVESALGSLQSLGEQERLQAEVLVQANLAFTLAEARYRAGAVDLLTMLDAQRTLYAAQDQTRQIRLARLQGAVNLYRALGGGWSAADSGEL